MLYCRKDLFSKWEEHTTNFSTLAAIELNLQVEFKKSCKWWAQYIYLLRANCSYEQLQAKRYNLRTSRYEIRATRQDMKYDIASALADDITISYLDRNMFVRCRSAPHIDIIQLYWLIIRHLCQLKVVRYRCCTVQSWVNQRDFWVHCTEPIVCRILWT
jgi:hypothetical protein